MEKLEKQTPVKNEILAFADSLFLTNGIDGEIALARKNHLKNIADIVGELEGSGYEVVFESIPGKFGEIRVYITKVVEGKRFDILAFREVYSPPSKEEKDRFDDPYPDKESLKEVFKKATERLSMIITKKIHP
jgi:hypothetical protein